MGRLRFSLQAGEEGIFGKHVRTLSYIRRLTKCPQIHGKAGKCGLSQAEEHMVRWSAPDGKSPRRRKIKVG